MKKKLLKSTIFVCILFQISCSNPEGENFLDETLSLKGTYKLANHTILTKQKDHSGSSIEVFNDNCTRNSILSIASNNKFTLTNFSLDSNDNCNQNETETGEIKGIKAFYNRPYGTIVFDNNIKTGDCTGINSNRKILSFRFQYEQKTDLTSKVNYTHYYEFDAID